MWHAASHEQNVCVRDVAGAIIWWNIFQGISVVYWLNDFRVEALHDLETVTALFFILTLYSSNHDIHWRSWLCSVCLFFLEADSIDSNDSYSLSEAAVEVVGIPPDCTEEKLIMLLENRRYAGVADAKVLHVQFAADNHSRALVTFSSAEGNFRLWIHWQRDCKTKIGMTSLYNRKFIRRCGKNAEPQNLWD